MKTKQSERQKQRKHGCVWGKDDCCSHVSEDSERRPQGAPLVSLAAWHLRWERRHSGQRGPGISSQRHASSLGTLAPGWVRTAFLGGNFIVGAVCWWLVGCCPSWCWNPRLVVAAWPAVSACLNLSWFWCWASCSQRNPLVTAHRQSRSS